MSRNVEDALNLALDALTLIAAPMRPDGTFNRGREACQTLAQETMARIEAMTHSGSAPALQATAPRDQPFVVYADGACKGNPGPASWGVVVLLDGVCQAEDCGYLGQTTNQVAEICAAIEGLNKTPAGAKVDLYTDSQYVQKGLMEWRKTWERNGWKTAGGQPVANLGYWRRLIALADARQVTARWVKGHNGDPHNERADTLANEAIARWKST